MSKPSFKEFRLSVLFGFAILVLIFCFFTAPSGTGTRRSAQSLAPVPNDASTGVSSSVPDHDPMIETAPPSQLTGSVSEISAPSPLTNQIAQSAPPDEQIHAVQGASETVTNGVPALPQNWTNSLGMEFVAVPGTEMLFCVWLTRVKDYQAFAAATRTYWPQPKDPQFPVGPLFPIINVSYYEAVAFCKWLTDRERATGWLTEDYAYRLPTIREWVMAVCPASLSVGSATESKYPWGNQWPPWGIANLHPSLKVDTYRFTSPVGSFPANQFGLYDISGNASQWCEYDDPISKRPDRPRRGGSFAHSEAWMLLCADSASSASGSSAAEQGQLALGFRIILGREQR